MRWPLSAVVLLLAELRALARSRRPARETPGTVLADLSPAAPLWLRPVLFRTPCEVFGCWSEARYSVLPPAGQGDDLHPVRRVCPDCAQELVWLHGWHGQTPLRVSGSARRDWTS